MNASNSDQQARKQQTPQEQYANARGALLFFVICTALKLLFDQIGRPWPFPFTSELVAWICTLGEGGWFSLLGAGAASGFAALWVLSGKKHGAMTAALALYAVDTVVAVAGIAAGKTDTMILLCVVVRLLLLWTMIQGVKAGRLLEKAEREPMVILSSTPECPVAQESETDSKNAPQPPEK